MLFFGKRKPNPTKSEPKPTVRTDTLQHIVHDLVKYAATFGPDGNVYFVFTPKHKRWLCGITKNATQTALIAPYGVGTTPLAAARDAWKNAQKKYWGTQ